MTFILTIFIVLLSLYGGIFGNSINSGQSNSQDSITKNDINSIYSKLDEHYNEHGGYSTTDEFYTNFEEELPGIHFITKMVSYIIINQILVVQLVV